MRICQQLHRPLKALLLRPHYGDNFNLVSCTIHQLKTSHFLQVHSKKSQQYPVPLQAKPESYNKKHFCRHIRTRSFAQLHRLLFLLCCSGLIVEITSTWLPFPFTNSTRATKRYILLAGVPLGPTQFDSSMFAAAAATDSPAAAGLSTPEASGPDSRGKHKKKRKKNKKHKHKHKHEKHEKHDREKEKEKGAGDGGDSQGQGTPQGTPRAFSESIILDQPFSSDASNSPRPSKPESPEFEVI